MLIPPPLPPLLPPLFNEPPTRPGGVGKVVLLEVRPDRAAAAAAIRWPGYMCRPALALGRAAAAAFVVLLLVLLFDEASVKLLLVLLLLLLELQPPTIRKMGIIKTFSFVRSFVSHWLTGERNRLPIKIQRVLGFRPISKQRLWVDRFGFCNREGKIMNTQQRKQDRSKVGGQ